jgi:hypothetical protein
MKTRRLPSVARNGRSGGDVAGEINTDQKDQGTVGETLRLGHVPGREHSLAGDHPLRQRRRGRATNLAELVGTWEQRFKDLRRQILSDSFAWPWFVP